MSKGRPFTQYHLSKNTLANFYAVRVEREGIICMSEPRRSVNVMMVSNPLSNGRGPMKSIATESQRSSGTRRGWSGPIGLVVCDLFLWQAAHDGIYAVSKSRRMLGQ